MKKMVLLSVLLLAGCVRLPAGVVPEKNFRLERYLGKWYEIARLDHSFERGLTRVSAEYRLRPDGASWSSTGATQRRRADGRKRRAKRIL